MNSILRIGLALVCMGLGNTGAADAVSEQTGVLSGLISQVQELQRGQRYVEALLKLEEIEKSFPESADVCIIRGSIHMAPSIRDFAAAEASFSKAAALKPGTMAPVFNLAELQFVKHEWKEAKKQFEALMTAFPQMPQALRHLVLFKVLLCQLKLEDVKGAEAVLAGHFTFMDDTPAYYMSKAALAFQAKNETMAQEWLEKARVIFGANHVASYLDSLMEARWVPNIGLPPVSAEPNK